MTSPDDFFNRIIDNTANYNKDVPNRDKMSNLDTSLLQQRTPGPSEKWYHDIAITCNQCRTPLLVEYNQYSNELTAYELEDLTKEQKQIVHVHQCNDELANSVIKAIATNKRLLQDESPGDYHYIPMRDRN